MEQWIETVLGTGAGGTLSVSASDAVEVTGTSAGIISLPVQLDCSDVCEGNVLATLTIATDQQGGAPYQPALGGAGGG